MKIIKISLVAILLCAAKNNYAQLKKGTVSIGGNLSGSFFNTSHNNSDPTKSNGIVNQQKDFSLNINPSFGYMLSKNWMFMTGITFGYQTSKYSQVFLPNYFPGGTQYISSMAHVTNNTQEYGLNIGFRKYFMLPDSKFGFFIQENMYGGVSFNNRDAKIDSYLYDLATGSSNYSTYSGSNYDHHFYGGASVVPGIVYFATPRLALEATIGSLNYQIDNAPGVGRDIVNHNANLNLNTFSLGLRYSFVKK